MDQFGAKTPKEELETGTEIIKDILEGNATIGFSNTDIEGYFLVDNPEDLIKNKLPNEILTFWKWQEL